MKTIIARNTYNFDFTIDEHINLLATNKKHIIVVNIQGTIYCFNNNLNLLKQVFFPNIMYADALFIGYNSNNIGLFAPNPRAIFIIDISTNEQKKIDIETSNLYSETFEHKIHFGDLSPVYYWQDDIFIVYTTNHEFYQTTINKKSCLTLTDSYIIKKSFPAFYNYVMAAAPYIHDKKVTSKIFWTDILQHQFTYYMYDSKIIGFVDCKNNIYVTTKYDNNDLHSILHNNAIFIVVTCDSVQAVSNGHITTLLKALPQHEFIMGTFLPNTKEIVLLSRKWQKNTFQISLNLYTLELK
jgi:hypothetical protein